MQAATRTHVGTSSTPITLRPVEQADHPDMKPRGFWYEVDGDWRRWCEDESYGSGGHLHAVDLADANVLCLDTLDALNAFNDRYARPLLRMAASDRHDAIDWAAVAASHDGIEIAPYRWERRHDWLWYYGWDCGSGAIWRPKNATTTYLHPIEKVAADLNDLPVVPLPGSEGWAGAYEWGGELDAAFPEQDAHDFSYACEYNGLGPVEGHRVAGLVMVQQGERDDRAWIWHVTLDDGATWTLEGWCDYTGWDCQSGTDWTEGHAEIVPR